MLGWGVSYTTQPPPPPKGYAFFQGDARVRSVLYEGGAWLVKGLEKGMAVIVWIFEINVIKNTKAEEGKHIYLCLCLKEKPNFIISIFYAAMKN